jgi:hypothetical protein
MVRGQTKSSGAHKSARQAIRDWPVTERPREKLLHLGPDEIEKLRQKLVLAELEVNTMIHGDLSNE